MRDARMQVPRTALSIIKKWEGFEPMPYEDVVGIPTIGYGFTAPALERLGLAFPRHVTQKRASRILDDLVETHYAPRIDLWTTDTLLPHQLGALCSFCYNVGIAAFRKSTLARKLNAGEHDAAAREFRRWVYAGGEVYEGLVRRRADEEAYFRRDSAELPVAWTDRGDMVAARKVEPIDDAPTLDDLIPDKISPYYE